LAGFALWLKREHDIADTTIKVNLKKLKTIKRHVNRWDLEAVRNYIQDAI
jgi:hypothetical protein